MFGTEPIYYYFVKYLPAQLTVLFPLLSIALFTEFKTKLKTRSFPTLGLITVLYLWTLSKLPHKEGRFTIAFFPAVLILIGHQLSVLYGSGWKKLTKLIITLFLITSATTLSLSLFDGRGFVANDVLTSINPGEKTVAHVACFDSKNSVDLSVEGNTLWQGRCDPKFVHPELPYLLQTRPKNEANFYDLINENSQPQYVILDDFMPLPLFRMTTKKLESQGYLLIAKEYKALLDNDRDPFPQNIRPSFSYIYGK